MSDSQRSDVGPIEAHCGDCGARFKVRSAERTYRCTHCGGAVVAGAADEPEDELDHEPEDGGDGEGTAPAAPPASPARRERARPPSVAGAAGPTRDAGAGSGAADSGDPEARRRAHAEHVASIKQKREERRQFTRHHQNLENAFGLIGNVLIVAVFMSGLRIAGLGILIVAYASTGELPSEVTALELFLATALELVYFVLAIQMKRHLRHAPVRIAGILALVKTVAYVVVVVPDLATLPVHASSIGSFVLVIGPVLFVTLIVAFHWYAFVSLRRHAAEIQALRHSRFEDQEDDLVLPG
jgi:predicted  nucleic acid-binding Zn-ribbon protein